MNWKDWPSDPDENDFGEIQLDRLRPPAHQAAEQREDGEISLRVLAYNLKRVIATSAPSLLRPPCRPENPPRSTTSAPTAQSRSILHSLAHKPPLAQSGMQTLAHGGAIPATASARLFGELG